MFKSIASLTAMAAIMMQDNGLMGIRHPDRTTRHEVIPNGCRKYYFSKYGGLFDTEFKESVFQCTASNENNAKRKYLKWKNGNQ